MSRETWIADALADAFRGAKGFRVEAYSGFASRGSTDFAPIGLVNHHTGPGGYDNLLRYMAEGSSISPLCNWATSRPVDGVVRITAVSAGRANHAGKGGAGRGGTDWIPTDAGNRLTIGGEHQNDGAQAWPGQQLEAIAIGSAALLRRLGRAEDRAALHKTYAPGRKPDMHTVSLAQHQSSIRAVLNPVILPATAPEAEMFRLIQTVDTKRLYAVSGNRVCHMDWDEFLSFIALGLFENPKDRDGNHVPDEAVQLQVDRVAASMRRSVV